MLQWRLFRVMLWKNFLLMRQKRVTVIAITALPILSVLLMIQERLNPDPKIKIETEPGIHKHYNPGDKCVAEAKYGWTCSSKTILFFIPDVTITRTVMSHMTKQLSE